jgi:hypothetical protein
LGTWWARAVVAFDDFLLVLFALMAIGSLALLVPYLRGVGGGKTKRTGDRDPSTESRRETNEDWVKQDPLRCG